MKRQPHGGPGCGSLIVTPRNGRLVEESADWRVLGASDCDGSFATVETERAETSRSGIRLEEKEEDEIKRLEET